MKNIFKVLAVNVLLIFSGCQPNPPELKDYLDGWEYYVTFKTYPYRSITVIGKHAKIISGDKNVLVVELERRPILKADAPKLMDLHSSRFLYAELNLKDTLVNPVHLGSSKIIREIISMSPQYGVNELDSGERIEIKKLSSNKWRVKSDLEDFQFEGEFSFADSSTLTSKCKQMLNN